MISHDGGPLWALLSQWVILGGHYDIGEKVGIAVAWSKLFTKEKYLGAPVRATNVCLLRKKNTALTGLAGALVKFFLQKVHFQTDSAMSGTALIPKCLIC